MVASMKLDARLKKLQAARARQEVGASDKNLGILVRMFIGNHLTPTLSISDTEQHDARSSGESANVAWGSIRFRISMSPERHAQTTEALAELVALRIDIVHHFIERFDISEENGCRAATAHLDRCDE